LTILIKELSIHEKFPIHVDFDSVGGFCANEWNDLESIIEVLNQICEFRGSKTIENKYLVDFVESFDV